MSARPIINHQPVLPLRSLLRRTTSMAEALAGCPWRFAYARDAIYWAVRGLGLPAGTPIWVPSFHCGIEVRAAADAGCTPRFYRVQSDLAIDLDHLLAGLDAAPGPVLAIHYFGVAQPEIEDLAKACRDRGVVLLEDCAHALLSRHRGRDLGSFAPLATFSLYKTLGSLDGGALRVDHDALREILGRDFESPPPRPRPWTPTATYRDAIRRGLLGPMPLRRYLRRSFTTRGGRSVAFTTRVEAARARIFEQPRRYRVGMSRLSAALVRGLDPEAVVTRRRAAWRHLDRRLRGVRGYRPVFSVLSDGCCPLYLPIDVDGARDDGYLALQAAGIDVFLFGIFHHPAMPPEHFPECTGLRDRILCLPVHQDLSTADLDRIVAHVTPLLAA